jgi:hypothetical protein
MTEEQGAARDRLKRTETVTQIHRVWSKGIELTIYLSYRADRKPSLEENSINL